MKLPFPKRLQILLAALIVCAVLASVSLCLVFSYYRKPLNPKAEAVVFNVPEGWTLRDVALELERSKIIRSGRTFRVLARFRSDGRHIKAGEYELGAHMRPGDILDKLTRGAVLTHSVTIPEGYTAEQIGDLLEKNGMAPKEAFMVFFDDASLMEKHNLPGPTLEGYLFPDTYHFARGVSVRKIVETLILRFRDVFEPLKARAEERRMSLHEVVTLASIVEKETGRLDERPIIASVFLNRLERGMRLQTDPTVIYGIQGFNGNLTRKDLQTKTPYNTYRIKGLPPGPIANPGEASLRAVLYPSDTDYLFFVSKNDGSHQFSKTLSEHNRAVRKYQIRGVGRNGKTS